MQRVDKLWFGIAMSLALLQLAASVLLQRGYALSVCSDVIYALVLGVLLIVFTRNAFACRGRVRTFWILQTVCWALWLIDQGWWIFYDVILDKQVPDMFLGDSILFLTGLPMLAGLLLRPDVQPSKQSARLEMIDFLHLMLWWIYFYVFSVICWNYILANSGYYNQNYDRLYLLQVLLLAVVLGLLLKRSEGPWRRFYAYFLGAFIFNSLSTIAENYAIERNDYYNGSWYDIPFVASLAFFIVLALKGRELSPASKKPADHTYAVWISRVAVIAVLSLPIVIVAVVTDDNLPPQISRFRIVVTALTILGLAALVFVKQQRLHEELRLTNQSLEFASMTDPLTKIRNRRFFSATIEGDVGQTIRLYRDGNDRVTRDLVFYLIDLDNFKEVNDQYGHEAGDRVLVETAYRIQNSIRDSDFVVRWGGEEFLVVSRYTDRRRADLLALRIIREIRERPYFLNSSQQIQRTCSIGWAAFPWREEDISAMGYEEVLNMADRALSHAKRAGKNQVISISSLEDTAVKAQQI